MPNTTKKKLAEAALALKKEMQQGLLRPDLDTMPSHIELTEVEAAAALGSVQPVTLMSWRSMGAGPAYSKIGRAIRYRVDDLIAFREARRRRIEPKNITALKLKATYQTQKQRQTQAKAQPTITELFGEAS